MHYHPETIEPKWRKIWEDTELYKVSNHSEKPKYYVLDMFPYPSGAGLHVGHPLGYIASDIYSRYKRLKGFNVLHPMGYDAFGLPAEQYAIQTGVHPADSTAKNIKRYREQLDNIGFSFDWSREVITSDPKYYKWTQWIFLKLFDFYYDLNENKALPISCLIEKLQKRGSNGVNAFSSQVESFSAEEWAVFSSSEKDSILMNYRLAYRKTGYVNWCEALGTVLANDEVKDGKSERGGHPVEKKPMLQWSLRITAYAERLLNDLENLEWTDSLKAMQRNWIGKSTGAQVFFGIENSESQIEIFTTRPDTIFGATFMVLAPEHALVEGITSEEQKDEVQKYVDYVSSRSEVDRVAEAKEVTGVFTGAFAIHPFTKERIPIWLGEYVLKDYGTGAIMAVPSDDERDQIFAHKFGLTIIPVVDKTNYPEAGIHDKVGTMINSDFINGMEVKDAIEAVIRRLETLKIGQKKINYKLRDANFSRQRYWGEPFPIRYNDEGVAIPLEDDALPLELPEMEDFKPASGGKSPLARDEKWVHQYQGFNLETDTMPGFAGSSWYFLRYMDPDNTEAFASSSALEYWGEVDLYVGGTEHAVGHLMYSRFWHKFLNDLGYLNSNEPFKKLINQGMITAYGYYAANLLFGMDDSLLIGNAKDIVGDIFNKNGQKYTGEGNPVRFPYVLEYLDAHNRLTKSQLALYVKEIGHQFHVSDDHDKYFWVNDDSSEDYFTINVVQEKMSKSKFNVENPDEVVARYGADCFRMYEMFLGPIEQSKPWDTKGIDGVQKFLRKYWSLFMSEQGFYISDEQPQKEALKVLHQTIKKVTDDIERFSFNTCVSAFMMCVNELKRMEVRSRHILEPLNILLAPFAPFITEEIWALCGHASSVHAETYPTFDPTAVEEDAIEYPICVNGKKRDVLEIPKTFSQQEIQEMALNSPKVMKYLEGKDLQKVIVVPNRMINFVVKE